MRRFIVAFNGDVVGSTDLEFVDDGMGVACGRFFPEPQYEIVRPDVIRAAQARHQKRDEVAAPQLDLTTGAGELIATTAVVIDDSDDVDVDPEITAFLADREHFQRLLGGLTSR